MLYISLMCHIGLLCVIAGDTRETYVILVFYVLCRRYTVTRLLQRSCPPLFGICLVSLWNLFGMLYRRNTVTRSYPPPPCYPPEVLFSH
jgi:hypothetical protein